MKIVSNEICDRYYDITEASICAAPINKGSICSGDSGSPLTITNKYGVLVQVGIASRCSIECEKDYPAVFERITYFLDWIETTTIITKILSFKERRH